MTSIPTHGDPGAGSGPTSFVAAQIGAEKPLSEMLYTYFDALASGTNVWTGAQFFNSKITVNSASQFNDGSLAAALSLGGIVNNVPGMIMRQFASSGTFAIFADSGGTHKASVNSDGSMSAAYFQHVSASTYAFLQTVSPNSLFRAADPAHVAAEFRGAAAQSANISEWKSNGNAVMSTVSENGYITTRNVSAPADAELSSSEVTFWLDATPGATKFMVKAKDSGGTVRTATVALA